MPDVVEPGRLRAGHVWLRDEARSVHALSEFESAVAFSLQSVGPQTTSDLAAKLRIGRTTVFTALAGLSDRGLVEQFGRVATARRPAAKWRLTERAGLVVGVLIGRTHFDVAVGNLAHEVLAPPTRFPIDAAMRESFDLVLDTVELRVREVCAKHGVEAEHGVATKEDFPTKVIGVGLGMPSSVDESGLTTAPEVLDGGWQAWAHFPAGTMLQDRLRTPVLVDNDANLGALGEYVPLTLPAEMAPISAPAHPPAGESKCLIFVSLSTGVGAGILINGAIHRGAAGTAGEFGHTSFWPMRDEAEGDVAFKRCRCGNLNCLEQFAGGSALTDRDGNHVDVTTLVTLAIADPAGPEAMTVRTMASHAGESLAAVVNILGPDLILIGGALARAGDLVVPQISRRIRERSLSAAGRAVEVRVAAQPHSAPVLGALAKVLLAEVPVR